MATATANGVARTKTEEVIGFLRENEGQPLPSNNAIAEMFGTDEGTVRRAKAKMQAVRIAPALVLDPVDVPIAELASDVRLQCRPLLDAAKVAEYAEGIAEGRVDPIHVAVLPDGRKVVTDGYHRVRAHLENDLTAIPAFVRTMTWEEAVQAAAAANADHGLPRDTPTKEAAVVLLLSNGFDGRTTAWLAEAARVSRPFAEKVRRAWEAGRTTSGKRTARNGHVYEARPQPAPPDREPGEDDDLGDEPDVHVANTCQRVNAAPPEPAKAKSPEDVAREQALALPLAAKLSGSQREHFVRSAALYFLLGERRQALGDLFRHHNHKPDAGEPADAYGSIVHRFLTTPHPRDWKLCLAGDHGRGCKCRSRGFVIG